MTMPVLWLHGSPGAGKSTVAWRLFTGLGVPAGFVDIDQLGMCYGPPGGDAWAPEPAGDHGRYRLKDRNLRAVVPHYAASGARCLVVSGILDPDRGAPEIPGLSLVRLDCDRDELHRRLTKRRRPADSLDEIERYTVALDRLDLPGQRIDTTGRSVAEVVAAITVPSIPIISDIYEMSVKALPGEIIWLCGPPSVGKSTVGWSTYRLSNQRGVHTAFADLDQLGFRTPRALPHHRLRAANLATLWHNFHTAGARRLIVAGPSGDLAAYRTALPQASFRIVRLEAAPEVLAARAPGEGPPLTGNSWTPAPGNQPADEALTTDDRTPEDLAAAILSPAARAGTCGACAATSRSAGTAPPASTRPPPPPPAC
ncbi:hypothetical protein [Actinoplanes sp. NBRC 101535]|uniref:hypothetical protein n=1 Tax=Actinoplanes sp. NBRC 101535 TaxID=3032196 RepID=UPI0024A4E318|nr:hypothetical protein [Actinoplanes sp. NBRC 101535]GLY03112.1 hypothetical protein Acsp01_34910 [Actinoplanes sp. NBRC 101535]